MLSLYHFDKKFPKPAGIGMYVKSSRVIFNNLQASVVKNLIFLTKYGMCLYQKVSSSIIHLPPTPF